MTRNDRFDVKRAGLVMLGPILISLLSTPPASANLLPGVLADFEDGTVQGWSAGQTFRDNTVNLPGGPAGSTRALEVSPTPHLAVFNDDFAGVIDPAITSLELDMMRPVGEPDLEMRMVLFGPGDFNRWTSTEAAPLPGDGAWYHYSFSILEEDLTEVLGVATYAELLAGFAQIVFRYDAGAPSSGGSSNSGTFHIDNVEAMAAPRPEPGAWSLTAIALALVGLLRGRSTQRP